MSNYRNWISKICYHGRICVTWGQDEANKELRMDHDLSHDVVNERTLAIKAYIQSVFNSHAKNLTTSRGFIKYALKSS